MKKNLLKSLCIALLLGGTAQMATAQGIVVNKTDGTKVYYKASEVQSVGVYGYDEEPEPEGHEWVDLGLPSGTLWATYNVGASKPEEYGDYFAWGETTPKSTYDWSTYKWCNGSNNTMTKYCTQSKYGYNGFTDNLTELQPADDAATANWGSPWRMPSLDQIQELCNSSYTTSEWTQLNGVNGFKVTSKSNGNSIFLPVAGYLYGTSLLYASSEGYYWSSSLTPDKDGSAYYLKFYSGLCSFTYSGRNCGRPVRAVCP